MKKILSFIIALVMVFSIVACESSSTDGNENKDSENESVASESGKSENVEKESNESENVKIESDKSENVENESGENTSSEKILL